MAKVKKRRKHRKWLIALLVVLVLLVSLLGGLLYLASKINTVELDGIEVNDFDDSALEGYTNIAIFGVDSRSSDLDSATRSDTIIICSINNKTKDVKLVSVYRDTLASINDSYSKINAAYAKGSYTLAINTLNKHLDLDISEFITVNFSAVTDVVNKLGGIEITVEDDEISAFNKNIKDCNSLMDTDSALIESAGTYTLDGTQALAYARIRKTSGNDFRRTERQRTVIDAILTKAKSSSVTTLASIVNDMLPEVMTSLSLTELLSLAKNVGSYNIAEQSGFPFDLRNATVNSAAVLIPETLTSNVSELHEFLFGTEDYTPSETVQSISSTLSTY